MTTDPARWCDDPDGPPAAALLAYVAPAPELPATVKQWSAQKLRRDIAARAGRRRWGARLALAAAAMAVLAVSLPQPKAVPIVHPDPPPGAEPLRPAAPIFAPQEGSGPEGRGDRTSERAGTGEGVAPAPPGPAEPSARTNKGAGTPPATRSVPSAVDGARGTAAPPARPDDHAAIEPAPQVDRAPGLAPRVDRASDVAPRVDRASDIDRAPVVDPTPAPRPPSRARAGVVITDPRAAPTPPRTRRSTPRRRSTP